MSNLAVIPVTSSDEERASKLADKLELPLLPVATDAAKLPDFDATLMVEGAFLSLQKTGARAPGPVRVDFGSPEMRHRRRGGANELLGRAVGVGKKSGLRVVDATAGLGRDAFVLADLGCKVSLWERDTIVGELLLSGLEAAGESEDPWLRDVAARMELGLQDVRESGGSPLAWDVIYLDPMFPARQKQAAVKKEMALFQWLLQDTHPDNDVEDLLQWALDQDVARVVVKRPARSEQVAVQAARIKPSHAISGKAVRYDVYVLRGLSEE
jgi:16S rRNA (guanine1516-N2)-methyltransferase